MLPPAVSEDTLSFLDGRERPAITVHLPVDAQGVMGTPRFTKDVLKAAFLTPAQLEERYFDERGNGDVTKLDALARRLFASRSGDPAALQVVENEMGIVLSSAETAVGAFILQESKFALNAAIAAYFRSHKVPSVFRIQGHAFDEDGPYIDPDAPASYSADPREHVTLGFPQFAHADRPLSRYGDLLLLTNLVALMDGRTPPYGSGSVAYAVKRLNTVESLQDRPLIENLPLAVPTVTPEDNPKRIKGPGARTLLARLRDESAHAGEVATALLGEVRGDPEAIYDLRRVAAEFIGTHVGVVKQVVNIAVEKGWLQRRVDADNTYTITDAHGDTYPYELKNKRVKDLLTLTKLLSSISGQEIIPDIPTFKEWVRANPLWHFNVLEKQSDGQVGLGYTSTPNEDGTMTIAARITIYNETHDCIGVVDTSKAARDAFLYDLIREFKLMHLPDKPPMPPQVPRETTVTTLAVHSQRRGAALPEYTFPFGKDKPTPDATFLCRVKFINIEGAEQFATAYGLNTQKAKEAAAKIALSSLPPVPPKQKRKKLTTENPPDPMET